MKLQAGQLFRFQSPGSPAGNAKETSETPDSVQLTPPDAEKKPELLTKHGDTRVDNYYWLNQKENPEVISYLEAENTYTEQVMRPTEKLQAEIFDEIKSRLPKNDQSLPFKRGDYQYYSKRVDDQPYLIQCRKLGEDGPEEVFFDMNEVAKDLKYASQGALALTPDQKTLGYSLDTDGSELYTIRVKDLATGKLLPDEVKGTSGEIAWAPDGKSFFYATKDSAKRTDKIFRHYLGTDPSEDKMIYHQPESEYFMGFGMSRDRQTLAISVSNADSSETLLLDPSDPEGEPEVVLARQPGVRYNVSIHGDDLYIVTNADGAVDNKLIKTSKSSPGRQNWEDVIPAQSGRQVSGVMTFKDYLVTQERSEGLTKVGVHNLKDGSFHYIDTPENLATVWASLAEDDFDTSKIRFGYESMITPSSVFEYDMESRTRELKKQQTVNNYDPSQFTTERTWAEAEDGTKVPISLVYKKGLKRDGSAKCLMMGYGSYGATMDPYFSPSNVSLLERGMVFAIAHPRGGGEMGRNWYEDGKFLKKENTFTDFIACAEHLKKEGYTSSENLAITGGSAGGYLMGAVLNMSRAVAKAAVAAVPFVDVLTTMLDPSLPLTVQEYEEWGNPEDKVFYDYMKKLSPVDNIKEQDYMHLLVTAGLNDPRVSYHEPAKWVAKLRDMKTDDNMLLFKTNMDAGHGGGSGRDNAIKEKAFEFAFILKALGMEESTTPPES